MGCCSWIKGHAVQLDEQFNNLSIFHSAGKAGWKYTGNFWCPPGGDYGDWEDAPSDRISHLLDLSKKNKTLIGFSHFFVDSSTNTISLLYDIRKSTILIDLHGGGPKTAHGGRAVNPEWALGLMSQLQLHANGYTIQSVEFGCDLPW